MGDAEWRLSLYFDPAAIRGFDPRRVVSELVSCIEGLEAHREWLCTIVAELFNNAIEHGLLTLDSSMKYTTEGFQEYYRRRDWGIDALDDGWVKMEFVHQPTSEGGFLQIEVIDSGNGFDYTAVAAGRSLERGQVSRGLMVVRNLCADVQHSPPGNRVKAIYEWTRNHTVRRSGAGLKP